MLAWAATKSTSWRPRYYLALVHWGAANLDEARRLLDECGDRPDYAPFYAARSLAFADASPERATADLERAARLDPGQWRFGRMLAERQLRQQGARRRRSRRRATTPPGSRESYILGMLHAKALLANGRYGESASRLAGLHVIPYEGSIEGRRLYREAHLMLAVESLKKGDATAARREVDAARLWPENLGAGKPYTENVDERLEDWLAAQCLAHRGRTAEAQRSAPAGGRLEGSRAGRGHARPRARAEADGTGGRGAAARRRLGRPGAGERRSLPGRPGPTPARSARRRTAPARRRGSWPRG